LLQLRTANDYQVVAFVLGEASLQAGTDPVPEMWCDEKILEVSEYSWTYTVAITLQNSIANR